MNRDHQAYTQDPYAPPHGNPAAETIREASLRNKADETNGYLMQAHALMDELEDALHGPQPRGAEDTKANPGHPGLRTVLGANSERAAVLVGRLSTLLGSL
jgi:hypothetical protein